MSIDLSGELGGSPLSGDLPPVAGAPVALPLRHNFYWTFAGNAIYAGCQWAMLMVLAKLGSPEMVGQFSLALAITAPVVMFTNLQLRAVQATDAREEYRFGDYVGLRLIGTALALIAICTIILISQHSLPMALIVGFVGLAKSWEALSDVIYGLMQRHERMDRIAISMMLKGPLSLLALGLGVYLTRGVLGGVAGLAIVWLALLFGYDVRSAAFILRSSPARIDPQTGERAPAEAVWRPHWDRATLGKLTRLSLPLGLVMMLVSLVPNIPRYFIEHYRSTHELGIFSALSYLQLVGVTVVGALGQSATPRLARYYADGNVGAFRGLLIRLLGIGAALGVVGLGIAVLAGREILALIYRPEYAEHLPVFIWIMVASGVAYVTAFLGYGMTAARYFKAQLPLYIAIVAATAAACFILVPTYGLMGAAWANLVSSLVTLAGSLVIVTHAVRAQAARAAAAS